MSKVPEGHRGGPRNARSFSTGGAVGPDNRLPGDRTAPPTISESPTGNRSQSPAYAAPTPDLVNPTRSHGGRVDGTGRPSERPSEQHEVRVDRIIVPAPDPDVPATREVSQAGDSTGKYSVLTEPSSWRGVREVGPKGEVRITYAMSENVAPLTGALTSPMTDADRAAVASYGHHVTVIPERTTPAKRKADSHREDTATPREQSRDGVAADFLYTSRQRGGVTIQVYTSQIPDSDQQRALLNASLQMDHAENYPSAENARIAAAAEVLHEKITDSLRSQSKMTVTRIVVSSTNSQDAVAAAQDLASSPTRDNYPFRFKIGGYHTNLDDAVNSIPSDSSGWHTAQDNGILTRLPTVKEHPGTPRSIDIGASPNSPEIPAGVPKATLGINAESGQPHEYPYMDTHLVVAAASGWGKTNLLVDSAGSVVEANDSPAVREAAGGRGINTAVVYWSLASDKVAPTQRLADRIHSIPGHEDEAVVDIRLAATGGDQYPGGIDIMEVPEGYKVGTWMNEFVEMSILGWAADHKNRQPGEDTDASERALRDRWREVLSGSEESGNPGLMWKKGWDVQLDRSRYLAGNPAPLNMEETVAAMMQTVLSSTISGESNPQKLGEHSRDYGDWLRRNAFSAATGQTGRLLHAKDQQLDLKGMLEKGNHASFSLNGVAQPAFVAAAYMTKLRQEQWVLNHAQDAATRPIIRQAWQIDEAGVMLNNTVGERFLTDITARARSEDMSREAGGVTVALGVQDLGSLPDGIGINAQAVVVGATPAGPVQKRIVEEFGLTPAARDRLRNLPPGQAFVKSPYQRNDRVNQVITQNLDRFPRGVGQVADLNGFLRVGPAFDRPVPNEIREPALDFLRDPRGEQFQFHTNIAVGVYVDGTGHTEAGDGLKTKLDSYLDERMREVRLPADEKAALRGAIRNDIVRLSIARAVRGSTLELLKSGIDPDVVAKRMASWMPAIARGDNPNERFIFDTTAGESFFDAVTQDGTFNAIKKKVQSNVPEIEIAPAFGINLEAENGITQLSIIDNAVKKGVEEKYRSLRGALVDKQKEEGSDAFRVPDYDQKWKRELGDIPGITVADGDGRLGATVGEQLIYLERWEARVALDPSLLGGEKWKWVADQIKKIEDHVASAPALPDDVRVKWETLYKEIIPDGVSFAAGSAREQLHIIDVHEEAWRQGLKARGEYRPTDLAEIVAPGTAGRTFLEAAVIADAVLAYPTWSGHQPVDRAGYTTQAYVERKEEAALSAKIESLLEEALCHPLGRQRIARQLSRLVRETIEIRDGRRRVSV